MKIIGILAKKLDHSLSPTIHNHWSKKTKTNLRYKKFEVKEKKLVNFFYRFRKNTNFKGFNVTIPYKEECVKLCDKITIRAKKIGSVNLIYKKGKIICGDNTDVVGFAKCFSFLKIPRTRSILLIGAGGAARSILFFLNQKNVENIDVFATSLKRKRGILSNFSIRNFTNKSTDLKKKYDLIINASSAGMIGKKKMNRNILKLVPNALGVIDIVYNPLTTELLKKADNCNIKNIGGMKMLIEQAKPSYEKWSNKKIKVDNDLYNIVKLKL